MAKNFKTAILITGDAKGGVRAVKATQAQIESLDKSVNKSSKSMAIQRKAVKVSQNAINGYGREVKAALGIISGAALAREALKLADASKQMEARLRLATDSQLEFAKAQQAIVDISRNTFTSLETNTTLYARMAIATKDLNIEQETLFKAAESLQNSFRVYGTTTEEAASATLQLTQALAKGKLDGDEFRSVMENAPLVMQALQKELKITKAELFEFSKDGKLQVQDLVNALANSSEEFARRSADVPATLAESFVIVKNELLLFIGDADKATGATDKLSKVILLLAENIGTVLTVITGGVALKLLGPVIGSIGVAALTTTKAIGLFGVGLVTTNARAAVLEKTLLGLRGGMALLGGPAGVAVLAAFGAFKGVQALIEANNEKIQEMAELTGDVAVAMGTLNAEFDKGFDAENSEAFIKSLETLNNELDVVAQKLRVIALEKAAALSAGSKNDAISQGFELATNFVGGNGFSFNEEVANENKREAIKLAKLQADANKFLTDTFGELYQAAKVQSDLEKQTSTDNTKAVNDYLESAQKQLDKLQEQNEAYGKTTAQIALLQAEKAKLATNDTAELERIDKLAKAIAKEAGEYDALVKAQKDQLKQEKIYQKAIERSIKLFEERQSQLESIIQSTETQNETITRVYEEQISLIDQELALMVLSVDRIDELQQAKDRLTAEYKKQQEAALNEIDTIEELIAAYDEEIDFINASEEVRLRTIAARELESLGIKATTENIDELIRKKRELAALEDEEADRERRRGQTSDIISGGIQGLFTGGTDGFISSLDGVFDSALAGFSDAFSTAFTSGAGVGGSFSAGFAAIPVAGWIAAGIALSDGFFQDGWRLGDSDFGRFDDFNGVGDELALTLAVHDLVASTSEMLGISERWNNILDAGGSILTRLFGTKAPEIESSGFRIGTGGGGLNGELFANILAEGGVFRSDQRSTQTAELSDEVNDTFNSIIEAVQDNLHTLSDTFGTEMGEVVEGAFEQLYDKEGELIKEFSTFMGVVYEESIQEFAARLNSESVIAYLDTLIEQIVGSLPPVDDGLGGVDGGGDISPILDRKDPKTAALIGQVTLAAQAYRTTAESLVEFTQFAVTAVNAMVNDSAIFDTFAENLAITEDLANAGESLNDTWVRLIVQNELLSSAADLMGVSLDLTADQLTRLADDAAQAAGGLENFSNLWLNFFDNFYSPEELLQNGLAEQSQLLGRQASDLGLDSNITPEQFREQFEAALPTLSADEIAAWLELGAAITRVNDLVDQQVTIYQAQLDALNEYAAATQDIEQQIAAFEGTSFANTVASINQAEQERIATLNDLAIAAGLAAAKEEDLARSHRLTALQMEAAIAGLRSQVQGLVDELYAGDLDAQIAELEAAQSGGIGGAISSVGEAATNMFEQWERAIQKLRDYSQSLLIDNRFSPLEATERLEEAQAQFYAAVAAANGGDLNAANSLPELADAVLALNQSVNTSGSDYNDIFYAIQAALGGVDIPTGLSTGGTGGTSGTYTLNPSSQLQALYEERQARDDAALAQNRLELALQLQTHIAELSQAINQPVLQLLTELGVDVSDFLIDLGIITENATAETVLQLAAVATTFGIEVTELADSVGLSLGSLADAQSLLNDGLEAQINSLPAGIQGRLNTGLRAIENAADGTQRDAALGNMEGYINTLPADIQNALAPYFEGVDPTSPEERLVSVAIEQRNLLQSINIALGNYATVVGGPTVGTLPPVGPGSSGLPLFELSPVTDALGTTNTTLGAQNGILVSIRDGLGGPGGNGPTPLTPPQGTNTEEKQLEAIKSITDELKSVKSELTSLKSLTRRKMDESTDQQERIAENTGATKSNTDRIEKTPLFQGRTNRQGVAYGR